VTNAEQGCGLSRPDALLARAGRIFGTRWRVLLSILLTGLAASGACLILTVAAVLACCLFPRLGLAVMVMIEFSGMTLALTLWLWSQVAMFVALADPDACPGMSCCFDSAWAKVPGFFWTGLLWLAAGLGSFSFLIVPGLVAGVCLAFAPLIYMREDIGGLDALLKSHHYVRGRFWPVAGRLCLIGTAAGLPGLVPVAGVILGLMAWPFMWMNLSLLLEELRRLRQDEPFVPPRRGKLLLCVAMTGCLVPALLLGKIIGFVSGLAARPQDLVAVFQHLLSMTAALRAR
jgi:hypothetical protein